MEQSPLPAELSRSLDRSAAAVDAGKSIMIGETAHDDSTDDNYNVGGFTDDAISNNVRGPELSKRENGLVFRSRLGFFVLLAVIAITMGILAYRISLAVEDNKFEAKVRIICREREKEREHTRTVEAS